MNNSFIYWLLIGLSLISIFFILQIDFGIIPFFSEITVMEAKTERINNFLSNISQGVLIAIIFYFLLVFLPEYQRQKTIRKIIQPRINTISSLLRLSVAYFDYKYHLHSFGCNFEFFKQKDFSLITRVTNDKMNFMYQEISNSKSTLFSKGTITEIQHFLHERNAVRKKIDEIFSVPIISNEKDELIETLARLRDCYFYTGVKAFSEQGPRVVVGDFNKSVFEYYGYYLTLMKYAKIKKVKALCKVSIDSNHSKLPNIPVKIYRTETAERCSHYFGEEEPPIGLFNMTRG